MFWPMCSKLDPSSCAYLFFSFETESFVAQAALGLYLSSAAGITEQECHEPFVCPYL